jgi:mono/diheme cytochrome c family protein
MRTFILKSVAVAGTATMLAAPVAAGAETPLERGTYLMKSIVACGNCHTAPGGPMAAHELAGGFNIKKGTDRRCHLKSDTG